jgi:NADH-quinone oxidoreductase subunit N
MFWLTQLFPEIILALTACVLISTGLIRRGTSTNAMPGQSAGLSPGMGIAKFAAGLAVVMTLVALGISIQQLVQFNPSGPAVADPYNAVQFTSLSMFLRPVALATGLLILLLSWPSQSTGNASVHFDKESGEYYALILLALSGLLVSFSANDLVLLFMAIELASIPTYILVAMSRPLGKAQEAAIKYFFLGAVSAAILLMGFVYLYGQTGTTRLDQIASLLSTRNELGSVQAPALNTWYIFATVLVIIGLSFKLAAFPFQSYAADVYEGAATPVTALIGFVPKAVGVAAMLKVIWAVSGGTYDLPSSLDKMLVAAAIVTMTFGNVMGLVQMYSAKRALAYSSVAHSGYLLAGIALLSSNSNSVVAGVNLDAGQAVLFYLAVYGIMSTAAFGALTLIPSRSPLTLEGKSLRAPATTAETYDDLTGAGRRDPVVGLCLAVACLGLIGIPLTAGFAGKLLLLKPAFDSTSGSSLGLVLGIVLLVNSAIGAAYYLRIIGALFFRPPVQDDALPQAKPIRPVATVVSVVLCTIVVLVMGTAAPLIDMLDLGTESIRVELPAETRSVESTSIR